jgi:hypothetical protein
MLAHTTFRHIIIGVQLAIGIALLSASYFSGDPVSTDTFLKANTQQIQAIEKLQSDVKSC